MSWTVLEQIAKWVKSFACMRRTWIKVSSEVYWQSWLSFTNEINSLHLRSVFAPTFNWIRTWVPQPGTQWCMMTLDAEDCCSWIMEQWRLVPLWPADGRQISTLEGWRLAVGAYWTGLIGQKEPIPGFWCPMILNLVLYADDWSLVIRLHLICIVCKSWKYR